MNIKEISGLFLIIGILIIVGTSLYYAYATGGILSLLFLSGGVCILTSFALGLIDS